VSKSKQDYRAIPVMSHIAVAEFVKLRVDVIELEAVSDAL